jgi:NAD(P)-dependent dehydrogenase (short-subunit alcohol dehydrogenase family)
MAETRTAIVTGAAGAIGSACARRLAADGYRVLAADVEADRLKAAFSQDAAAGIVPVVADVSAGAGADTIVEAAGDRVDVLLNVAGVGDALMGIEELDDATWQRVIAVNQTGVFLLTRRVIPVMLAREAGVIINMSSVAGLRGGRAGFAYTATKWALVGMAQNIAAGLGPRGIRAHAICPSAIQGAETLTRGGVSETGRARSRRDNGKPPAGVPADVAATVAFLVSDEARHLNGLALPLDAGWLAF